MPHIIVEYSDNLKALDVPVLLETLHETLAEHDTINMAAIKTRAIPLQNCVVAENMDPDEMVHVTLKLLPGRSVALKKTMAEALFSIVQNAVALNNENCSLSVEVVELDAETYTK